MNLDTHQKVMEIVRRTSLGYDRISNPKQDDIEDIVDDKKSSSMKWLFAIGAFLLICVLGGGGYYFLSNKSESPFIVQEMDSIADIKDSIISTVDEISNKEESAKLFSIHRKKLREK